MKKLLSFIVVLLMSLSLISCNKSSNKLKVGMDLRYPPFETMDKSGKPYGISVDIANYLGEFLNKEVEIVALDFSNLIIALQNGEIDIVIGSMSITDERKEAVSFTEPYMYFKIISLLNKDFAKSHNLTEDSSIEDVLEIPNVKYIGLAAQVSTSIPENYGKDVEKVTSQAAAVESVSQGTHDIYLMSASPIVGAYKTHKETTLVLWDSFVSSPIAMAVRKGNTELLNKANEFISHFNDEGGVNDLLASKWDETLLEELERYGFEFFRYE